MIIISVNYNLKCGKKYVIVVLQTIFVLVNFNWKCRMYINIFIALQTIFCKEMLSFRILSLKIKTICNFCSKMPQTCGSIICYAGIDEVFWKVPPLKIYAHKRGRIMLLYTGRSKNSSYLNKMSKIITNENIGKRFEILDFQEVRIFLIPGWKTS